MTERLLLADPSTGRINSKCDLHVHTHDLNQHITILFSVYIEREGERKRERVGEKITKLLLPT
jgi:hypothetical protein